jgi:hypothetical protein
MLTRKTSFLRWSAPLRLAALAVLAAVALTSPARADRSVRPSDTPSVGELRSLTDHYRQLTWAWQRVAQSGRTQASFSYRRAKSRRYLRWTADLWTRRAYRARRRALIHMRHRFGVALPSQPGLRARLAARIAYERHLALRLRHVYPGHVSHTFATIHAVDRRAMLRLWQRRGAAAALAVARHAPERTAVPAALARAFLCIHAYEGAWDADTGNGYYGGLQMDLTFQRRYGPGFARRWGTADNWPAWAQLQAAVRAYRSGRGFWPWPSSARMCGLV